MRLSEGRQRKPAEITDEHAPKIAIAGDDRYVISLKSMRTDAWLNSIHQEW